MHLAQRFNGTVSSLIAEPLLKTHVLSSKERVAKLIGLENSLGSIILKCRPIGVWNLDHSALRCFNN